MRRGGVFWNRNLMTAFTVDSAGTVLRTIVDQAAGVAGDVDGELVRGASEFAAVRVVHL